MYSSSPGYYSNSSLKLEKQVESFLKKGRNPGVVPELIISPHGNMNECGEVLGKLYSALDLSKVHRVFLVGSSPVETGPGLGFLKEGFETPFGEVETDSTVIQELELSEIFESREDLFHAPFVEMQLLFLQRVLPNFEIVPITVKNDMEEKNWRRGVEELEKLVKPSDLFVSCSNLAVSEEEVQRKDSELITLLRNQEFSELVDKGKEYNMSGWRAVLTGIRVAGNYRNTYVFGHSSHVRDEVVERTATGFAGIALD